jgi:hypothetical protein
VISFDVWMQIHEDSEIGKTNLVTLLEELRIIDAFDIFPFFDDL